MSFRNCDWKSLAEIYRNEPEAFNPVSVKKIPYKNLDVNEIDLREYQVKVKTEKKQMRGYSRVQERVKNLRRNFRKQSQHAEEMVVDKVQ